MTVEGPEIYKFIIFHVLFVKYISIHFFTQASMLKYDLWSVSLGNTCPIKSDMLRGQQRYPNSLTPQ
jgi:hypothetical protein